MVAAIATVRTTAVTALKWNYLGMGVRSGSALLIGIVLARLLGPKPFGIVAIAALVIGFGTLLADFGFGSAVVQKASLSEEDLRFSFTVQVAVGCVLALICCALARPFAHVFHSREVAAVLCALAPVFPIQALGQTAASILKRQLRFRQLQTAQIASYLFGYLGLGLPLAYLGFGVWALVLAQLGQAVVSTVLLFRAAPHPVSPSVKCGDRAAIFSFGANVVGTNVVNWAILNLDNTFIGGMLGTVPLGLYSRAYNLASTPFALVCGLQQVLFPMSSRMQDDVGALRRIYLGSTALVATCMLPLMAVVGATAPTVIIGLYGPKWADAALLLRPLAVAMPLYALVGIPGPLLCGMGKVQYELRAQGMTAVVAIAAYIIAARHSASAVAWAVVLVYIVRLALVTRYAVRLFEVRWAELLATLRGPLLLGAVTAILTYLGDSALGHAGLPMPVRLLGVAVFAAASVLSVFRLMPRVILGRAGTATLQGLAESLPPFIHRFLLAVPTT